MAEVIEMVKGPGRPRKTAQGHEVEVTLDAEELYYVRMAARSMGVSLSDYFKLLLAAAMSPTDCTETTPEEMESDQ